MAIEKGHKAVIKLLLDTSAFARASEMKVSAKDVMGPEAAGEAVVVWAGRTSSSAVRALLADCTVVEGGGGTQRVSGRGVTGVMTGGIGLGAPRGEGVDISELWLLGYRP
ncbi:hypothetical protein B0H65DRAFT_477647 [Neurospora tetraspora]|uniref:Uncharacterized protein n=1 Tax=Neurospora tetraspora TaxID=94610 RepID=A0AAE0J6W1_9PEZI|nr:hypothetical protein B0H65DRAFT_477647 [Neurospora tetraspora]